MTTTVPPPSVGSQPPQQIVIVKGCEGFADRLQVLSHAIHYCQVHDAALCVDWRDNMWGQGDLDFDDYFELVGVCTAALSDVVERLQTEKGPTVVPSCWTVAQIEAPPDRRILHDRYMGPLMRNTYPKIEADVVVTNSRGKRMYHSDNLVRNIRLKKDVAAHVQKRLSAPRFTLPCTVVHLRGTDRFNKAMLEQCVAKLHALPPHCQTRVYVVSDMKDLIEAWIRRLPHTRILNTQSNILRLPRETVKGSHQYPKEVLAFYKVKKRELNVDTLVEFLGLCLATNAIGMSQSLFYKMSRFIHDNEGVEGISQWLHGFQPARTTLPALVSEANVGRQSNPGAKRWEAGLVGEATLARRAGAGGRPEGWGTFGADEEIAPVD